MKNKKRGRKYGLKSQVKGFLTFLVLGLSFIYLVQVTEAKTFKINYQYIVNTLNIQIACRDWDCMKNRYWQEGYPEDVETRQGYIREKLAWDSDLANEEIENLIRIAGLENAQFSPERFAPVVQRICKKEGRAKNRVVELYKNDKGLNVQDSCERYGETQIAEFGTLGIFQIIEPNFKLYSCEGDRMTADAQIDCAVKIYKKSEYCAWATSHRLGLCK